MKCLGGEGDTANTQANEATVHRLKPLITESSDLLEKYLAKSVKNKETKVSRADVYGNAFKLNEEIDKMLESLDSFSEGKDDIEEEAKKVDDGE